MKLTKPYHECPDFEECRGHRCPVDPKADRESEGSNLVPEGWEIFECWDKERRRAALGATRKTTSRSTGPNDGRYSDWFG